MIKTEKKNERREEERMEGKTEMIVGKERRYRQTDDRQIDRQTNR